MTSRGVIECGLKEADMGKPLVGQVDSQSPGGEHWP